MVLAESVLHVLAERGVLGVPGEMEMESAVEDLSGLGWIKRVYLVYETDYSVERLWIPQFGPKTLLVRDE
jgi:hypothetical protein